MDISPVRHSWRQGARAAAVGLVASLCCACATQPISGRGVSAADYAAILQLYAEFNTAIDLGYGDRYAATWTDDGEYTGGRGPGRGAEPRDPDVKGKEQLRAMARGSGGRHFVTNLVVTPTPGGAKATAYLLLMNARDIPPTVGQTSVYDDTLVKTKDGWKFKKRVNWRDDDDISPHKPKPMPPMPPRSGVGPPTATGGR